MSKSFNPNRSPATKAMDSLILSKYQGLMNISNRDQKISLDANIKLSPEEKTARAKKNWAKLRTHVKEMKKTANYFVVYLDEFREK